LPLKTALGFMSSSHYYYIGNNQNLFLGVFSLLLIAFILYSFGLPAINVTVWSVVGYSLYGAIIFLFAWLTHFSFRTYFRLRGHRRVVSINDRAIVFPELGDSLQVIELKFSDITEVYFAEGRYGIPSNLIIKYGYDGHAYIAKDYLKPQDFEAICSLIKRALKLKNIDVK
jgi:hypothetical protein